MTYHTPHQSGDGSVRKKLTLLSAYRSPRSSARECERDPVP